MTLFSYILLVLHPQHKLHYFKNAGWQDEWIKRAEEIVCMEFDLSYRSSDASWVLLGSKLNVHYLITPTFTTSNFYITVC